VKQKASYTLYTNNNNSDSGIIKADCGPGPNTYTHAHHSKTYIELQLNLSNKFLKLLVEVASTIPPANYSNY